MSMSEVINSIEREMFEENKDFSSWFAQYQQNPLSLTECRCTCGRLLGRFSGQAEIKCPKCGKMNVIGLENHADSCITR